MNPETKKLLNEYQKYTSNGKRCVAFFGWCIKTFDYSSEEIANRICNGKILADFKVFSSQHKLTDLDV